MGSTTGNENKKKYIHRVAGFARGFSFVVSEMTIHFSHRTPNERTYVRFGDFKRGRDNGGGSVTAFFLLLLHTAVHMYNIMVFTCSRLQPTDSGYFDSLP